MNGKNPSEKLWKPKLFKINTFKRSEQCFLVCLPNMPVNIPYLPIHFALICMCKRLEKELKQQTTRVMDGRALKQKEGKISGPAKHLVLLS